jgi:hypothetical protein
MACAAEEKVSNFTGKLAVARMKKDLTAAASSTNTTIGHVAVIRLFTCRSCKIGRIQRAIWLTYLRQHYQAPAA